MVTTKAPAVPPEPAAFARPKPFPEPNTPEWDAVNARRGALIDRKVARTATPAELEVLARLQSRCRRSSASSRRRRRT